jgi:phage protein U
MIADPMNIAERVVDALDAPSMIRLATGFADRTAASLADLVRQVGEPAVDTVRGLTDGRVDEVTRALTRGRIDDLAAAAGKDAIARLVDAGRNMIDGAMNRIPGFADAGFAGANFAGSLDTSDPPPVGDVLLMLGDFYFMVGTLAHQNLKRSNAYRWASQERILAAPVKQFVGVGDEKISLDGYLLPHYTGGADALEAVRATAKLGEPLPLIDHYGMIYGRYCIETIEETGSELDIHGQARRIDFSVALSAYGENAIETVPG